VVLSRYWSSELKQTCVLCEVVAEAEETFDDFNITMEQGELQISPFRDKCNKCNMALCRIVNLLLRHKDNLPVGVVYCVEGHISNTRTFSVFLGTNSEVELCSQVRACACACACFCVCKYSCSSDCVSVIHSMSRR